MRFTGVQLSLACPYQTRSSGKPSWDSLSRLPHSPSLVAIGLSAGYETWPPIGCHHPFVIGWSIDRLGLPSAPLHYGLTWPVGIPTVFHTSVTVPLHCPNGRQLPAARAVQRDCERVYSRRELCSTCKAKWDALQGQQAMLQNWDYIV